MRMSRFLPPYVAGPGAVGLLVLRLVAGTAMMFHGWPKIHLCLGLPDVTPCGIRVGFSISHYIWHPSSGWRRRLVIYEPRDQPDVGTAAGHPSALRLALQAEGHQPHGRQCLHSVIT